MARYIIDEEFRALLDPLETEELNTLHENIENDGEITDPIIIWKEEDIVVDGMNRYEYHLVTGIQAAFKFKSFVDRDDVKRWIVSRQLGRRNSGGMAKAQMRRLLVSYVAKKNPAPEPTLSNPKPKPKMSTNKAVHEVAEKIGVSPRQVFRDVEVVNILDSLPANVKSKIQKGSIAATPESLRRLDKLEGHHRQQVIDLISVIDPESEQQTFRHVDEIIEAVIENEKAGKSVESSKPVKKIEELRKKIEKFIADTPSLLDDFASLNGLTGDSWRDRGQAALKNFITIWREKCKRQNS